MHYYIRYRGGRDIDYGPVEQGDDQHPQLVREHNRLYSGRSITISGLETLRDRRMVGFSFIG